VTFFLPLGWTLWINPESSLQTFFFLSVIVIFFFFIIIWFLFELCQLRCVINSAVAFGWRRHPAIPTGRFLFRYRTRSGDNRERNSAATTVLSSGCCWNRAWPLRGRNPSDSCPTFSSLMTTTMTPSPVMMIRPDTVLKVKLTLLDRDQYHWMASDYNEQV